jgi:hypothetical protein
LSFSKKYVHSKQKSGFYGRPMPFSIIIKGNDKCESKNNCLLKSHFSKVGILRTRIIKTKLVQFRSKYHEFYFKSPNIQDKINLVPRAMPVRGLGWHWLCGNWIFPVLWLVNVHADKEPEPLNLGVPVVNFRAGFGSADYTRRPPREDPMHEKTPWARVVLIG